MKERNTCRQLTREHHEQRTLMAGVTMDDDALRRFLAIVRSIRSYDSRGEADSLALEFQSQDGQDTRAANLLALTPCQSVGPQSFVARLSPANGQT